MGYMGCKIESTQPKILATFDTKFREFPVTFRPVVAIQKFGLSRVEPTYMHFVNYARCMWWLVNLLASVGRVLCTWFGSYVLWIEIAVFRKSKRSKVFQWRPVAFKSHFMKMIRVAVYVWNFWSKRLQKVFN